MAYSHFFRTKKKTKPPNFTINTAEGYATEGRNMGEGYLTVILYFLFLPEGSVIGAVVKSGVYIASAPPSHVPCLLEKAPMVRHGFK